jgi:hypothetical protein
MANKQYTPNSIRTLGVYYGALIETDSNFLIALQNASIHQAALSGFGVYFRSPNQTNSNCAIVLLTSEYIPNLNKDF